MPGLTSSLEPAAVSAEALADINRRATAAHATLGGFILWTLRVLALVLWSLACRVVWWRGRKISFTYEDGSLFEGKVNMLGRQVLRGRVIGRLDRMFLVRFAAQPAWVQPTYVFLRNYRRTWCYGWGTKKARAFEAMKALEG